MQKAIKKNIFLLIVFVIFCCWFFGIVNAYQYPLAGINVVISSLAPQAVGVSYDFQFITSYPLTQNQKITITFPLGFSSPVTTAGNVVCPANMTASVSGRVVNCTVNPGYTHPATTTQIIVGNVTNPAKVNPVGIGDTHKILIETDAQEGADLLIVIIEPLSVRAEISPILNFEIGGLNSGEFIHNNTTTVTTTPASILFGTIEANIPVIAAQDLFVTTNAPYGFTVHLFQNNNLRNVIGDEIHCFVDGICVSYTKSTAWVSPEGLFGAPATYGHFGFTSEDQSLDINCDQNYYDFGGNNNWAGLSNNELAEVMRHCGPGDGTTRHEGMTRVGFQVEITDLQAPGEYTNTLSYVVTPTF